MTEQAPERQQLITLRIIWAALLMGQVAFFLVIAFLLWPKGRPLMEQRMLRVVFFCQVVMLLTLVPVTFVIRNQIFQRNRDERGNVRPAAYGTCNIIFWAGCEGVSMFGLAGALLANGPWPHLIVSIIAVIAQILAFPTGAPMRQSL